MEEVRVEEENVVTVDVNESYKCAVCGLREDGICKFYSAGGQHGIKCDGIMKSKNLVKGSIIDQNFVCLKTGGDFNVCVMHADDIEQLINGNAALMIGKTAIIFEGRKETK